MHTCEKKLDILTSEYSEVDWGDIMDERLLTSNSLRLLGCKDITGARDRTKSYKEVEADIAGNRVLCLICAARNGPQHLSGERVVPRASRRRPSDLIHFGHRLARLCVHDVCSVQCRMEVSKIHVRV